MKLTTEQVKEIESKASAYGCGAYDCLECSPLEYSCVYCGTWFETPILNGQQIYCDGCGSETNTDWQPNEIQLAFYANYGQTVTGELVPQSKDKQTLDTAHA